MDGTALIERFQLQVDDSSELSDSESLDLANEVYSEIQNDRGWEWLKDEFTGVTSTTVPYITLPTDFKTFSRNYEGNAVIFVGTQPQNYKLIPYSSRREYRDTDGYCYIYDGKLYFTKQPTAVQAVEYDYIKTDVLTASTEPLFIESLHDIISLGMAVKFNNIEMTDKGQSYQRENENEYLKKLSQLRLIDARNKLAIS